MVQEDVEPEALSARVPPLLLQPLVENAVRHGIMPREDGGTLQIEARRVGERLLLRVVDDGPGPPAAPTGGVGLDNTRARLKSLYGDNHRFTLQRADGGGCAVRVELPFRTTPDTELSLPAPDETVPEASLPASALSS